VILGLDHVSIVVADLEPAADAYEALIGRAGRRWEEAGAKHAWFQLSNTALDIVQPDGPGEDGDAARSRLDEAGEGLWRLAFAVDDLAETRRLLDRRGAPSALSDQDGRQAVLDAGATHGVSMTLIERTEPRSPTAPFEGNEIHGLDHVVVRTANPDRALALYAARLGLDLRLDRSNPAWGSRLLFLMCGDCVVEIGGDPKAPAAGAPDRLSGLAWRVGDPDGARARLAGAGLDVSEVRLGRKAGTKVFTVRSGIAGGPALVIAAGQS
jgi:catechol 2,3-dioxygenase-like lactoylglutathione lyase family enzyme